MDEQKLEIYAIEVIPFWTGEKEIVFSKVSEAIHHLKMTDFAVVDHAATLAHVKVIVRYKSGIVIEGSYPNPDDAVWFLQNKFT